MGLSIGVKTSESQVPATYGLLADLGFYGGKPQELRKEQDAPSQIIDRGIEWDIKRQVCKEAYARARHGDRIRSTMGPRSFKVLNIPKSSIKQNSKRDYASVTKAIAFSLIQSFHTADPIVDVYTMALLYPNSDFVYCENSEQYSIVLAQSSEIPGGYRPAKCTRTKALKTIFLQSFSRFLSVILDGSPEMLTLITLLEGWISDPLDAYEDQREAARSLDDDDRADRLGETIDILVECLNLIRDADEVTDF
jgi:hypothetical protein